MAITTKQVNEYLKLDSKISELSKEVEALKTKRAAMGEDIIKNFTKGITRIDTKLGSLTLDADNYEGCVKDWDKLYTYIKKSGEFGLLQKRLGQSLFKEMFEDGKKVPGVERVIVKKLRIGHKRGA